MTTRPVLVSHNAKSFESVVFMNSVSKTGVKFENIIGFVDSLPLFKDLLPGKKSYSQSSLVHVLVFHMRLTMHWMIQLPLRGFCSFIMFQSQPCLHLVSL